MTRLVRFSNNAVSMLASAITTGSTTLSLQAGDGSKFPTLTGTQFFMATLVKSDGTTEVVKVTARTGDTLTVVRAAEAVGGVQTAYAFSSGDRIEHRLTAKAIGDELDRLDQAALIAAQNKTADYTVTAADITSLIRMNTAGGNLTVTLPDITTLTDDFDVIVAKVSADSNVVTIARSGTDTINGATSYSLTNQWQGAWLTADRSTGTWTVIASGGGGVKANVDTFTGTGTAGPFTMSGDPGIKENTAVYVGGVYQQKSTYSLAGTSLTLGGNVPAGVSVEVVWAAPLQVGITSANQTTASDGSSGSLFTTVQGFITRLLSSAGSAIVGFIQAGTGAVVRWVQDKLRERVSPEDFGAKGDGTTDDGPSVQLAINYLNSVGGGVLEFTPGKNYFINSQINFCDNLTLRGYGAKLTIGRGFAGINRPAFKNFSGTDFTSPGTRLASKNITVLGFEVDGQDAGTAGASIANANMHGAVFCVGGWTAGSGVDGFRVRDCIMYSFAGAGAMAWKSSNVDISENRFKNFFSNVGLSMGAPIDCHELDTASINGNKINHTASGYSWHGIVILDWDAGSKNVTCKNNTITNLNQGDGISCEGNSTDNLTNGIFADNIILNCAGDGIGVDRCVKVTVHHNTIENISGMGVLFTETQYSTITDNTVTTCGLGGIVCRSGIVRSVVSNNTISGVTYQDSNYRGHGIEVSDTGLADSGQVEITDNIIRDVDGCGIFAGVTNGVVSDNNIYNAGRSASNSATLRAGVFALAPMYVANNMIVSSGNTQYAISSGANDFPSISSNRLRGTFGTAYYYIGYRGTGVYLNLSVNIEDASYDVKANIFSGRFNGTPAGYWYQGDTMLATQPAAAGAIGSVVVSTGTTWKTFGAISA